jgi:hypothetical protein
MVLEGKELVRIVKLDFGSYEVQFSEYLHSKGFVDYITDNLESALLWPLKSYYQKIQGKLFD